MPNPAPSEISRTRVLELLAVLERHQPMTAQQFAEAVFPKDLALWQSPQPKKRKRNWVPGGKARMAAACLLGKLRVRGLVSKSSDGKIFQLTPAGREYLHRPITPSAAVFKANNGVPQPGDPRWMVQADGSRLLYDGRDFWTWPVQGGLFKWSDRGWIHAA